MAPWKVQPLLLKRKVPDRSQSQHENYLHSKTRLLDYHDSAANAANSEFYSNHVIASRPIATSNQKHPVMLWPKPKITSHVVHFQSGKQKYSVYFAARGIALLWSFFNLKCSASGFVHLLHWAPGTSIRNSNEPGRVGIPAVGVIVVWDLSIVVSARLTETTLFMGKLLM